MMILFACLIDWLHSLLVEIINKLRHDLQKVVLAYAWAGMNNHMALVTT